MDKEEEKRLRRNILGHEYYVRNREVIKERNLARFRANHEENLARRRELYRQNKHSSKCDSIYDVIMFNGPSKVVFDKVN